MVEGVLYVCHSRTCYGEGEDGGCQTGSWYAVSDCEDDGNKCISEEGCGWSFWVFCTLIKIGVGQKQRG